MNQAQFPAGQPGTWDYSQGTYDYSQFAGTPAAGYFDQNGQYVDQNGQFYDGQTLDYTAYFGQEYSATSTTPGQSKYNL